MLACIIYYTTFSDNHFVICSVQDSVEEVSEDDSMGAGQDDVDEQTRSSQHLSTSTAEISLPPSEDSDRMSGQVENDDGLGLVQSDTPIGVADGESTQITTTLTAFSVSQQVICIITLASAHVSMLDICLFFLFGILFFIRLFKTLILTDIWS